jgi:hypothetical protein
LLCQERGIAVKHERCGCALPTFSRSLLNPLPLLVVEDVSPLAQTLRGLNSL